MTAKSFLFVGAWMQPLKALPLEQRWNVMEAIMEYSISGEVTMSLDVMETIAFGFIRNEIDRMKEHRAELRETRRASAKSRWAKEKISTNKTEETASFDTSDANACKAEQADAPYYILSESESESVSKSESEKKSSSTSSHVRVKVGAGKDAPYDDSQRQSRFFDISNQTLQPSFFSTSNQAKLEALTMKHRVSQTIADGCIPSDQTNGMLGVKEYPPRPG